MWKQKLLNSFKNYGLDEPILLIIWMVIIWPVWISSFFLSLKKKDFLFKSSQANLVESVNVMDEVGLHGMPD